MPDYEKAARRAAIRKGIDPDIFVAQLRQESGLKQGLTSSAGARDIAQFMPATAKQYGVTLGDGRARDDLDGAAQYMADNLKRTGGDYKAALSIYNSGRPDAYKDPAFAKGQTYNYVRSIMGSVGKPAKQPKLKTPAAGGVEPERTETTTTTPGVDNAGLRRQLVGDFLQQGGVRNSNAVLGLAASYGQAADVPGTTTTTSTSAAVDGTERAPAGSVLNQGTKGAVKALQWAESKIGLASSKETAGANRGGLADYANSRFGFGREGGQPWCAMFTSLATTKGGAPPSARTASVAEVRRKALSGEGYVKGLVDPGKAKPGDLVLWGDRHIGMVQRVKGGKIYYVAGNESDTVAEGVASAGEVDVVRPRYGKRGKKK
jgi:hypothetical protein